MCNLSLAAAPLKSAVLFLVFNRPETTKIVFEAIRKAKPPRLYIASDGPRENRKSEPPLVEEVRKIVAEIDWPCEVKTLFRDRNYGCKMAVSSGIDWFFENEEQGIILEDDCLPHADFFTFCETLLNRYAEDDRVWVVTGNNFQSGQRRGDASYYFSRYNHCWGWASWRRAWLKRDMYVNFWPEWKQSQEWITWLPDKVERRYWSNVFDRVHENKIDSWAYPWTASVWFHRGLSATPNVNLVSNIGFGPNSTHTSSSKSPLAKMPTGSIGTLKYSVRVIRDEEADSFAFDLAFDGRSLRLPYSLIKLPRRVLGALWRWIKKKWPSRVHE